MNFLPNKEMTRSPNGMNDGGLADQNGSLEFDDSWIPFYEKLGAQILNCKLNNDTDRLIASIQEISPSVWDLRLKHQNLDGSGGPLKSICPFTMMCIYNRGMGDERRGKIANALAVQMGLKLDVEDAPTAPECFYGIPHNHTNARFFGTKGKQAEDDIKALWQVFIKAAEFATSDGKSDTSELGKAFDHAGENVKYTNWNLTTGLYWAHPKVFLPLDKKSRNYIRDRVKPKFKLRKDGRVIKFRNYLELIDELKLRFKEESIEAEYLSNKEIIDSFPALATEAHHYAVDPNNK